MHGGHLPDRSTSLGGLVDVDLSEISREQSPEEPVARVRAWLGSAQCAHSKGSPAISSISRDAAHSASTGSLPLFLGDAGPYPGVNVFP
jgi:hypothetical protein